MDTFYFSAFLRTKNCRVIHNSLTSMKYFFIEYYFYEIPFFTIFCILYCHYILICYALFNFISFYSIFSFLSFPLHTFLFFFYLFYLQVWLLRQSSWICQGKCKDCALSIQTESYMYIHTGYCWVFWKCFTDYLNKRYLPYILFIFIYFIFSAYSQLYICLL